MQDQGVPAGPTISLAQAVISNWATGEVPGVERGSNIGLATWTLLDARTIAELTAWLQFVPDGPDDTKHVFTGLRDGRLLWARLYALPGNDDLGRRANRFWGHALVSNNIPKDCRGQSPLAWLVALPFFNTLEAAKAASAEGGNSLPPIDWLVPPLPSVPPQGPPDLARFLQSALTHARSATNQRSSPWSLPREEVRSPELVEVYRILPPSDWGLLPVDDGFDSVVTDPNRRYWVVGRSNVGTVIESERSTTKITKELTEILDRWALEMVSQRHWDIAVQHMPEVERAVNDLRSGISEVSYPPQSTLRCLFLDQYGLEVIIDEMSSTLRRKGWPPALAKQILHELKSLDFDVLAPRWARPEGSVSVVDRSDLMGFLALVSLSRIDPAALEAAEGWPARHEYPLTSACLAVTTHAMQADARPVRGLRALSRRESLPDLSTLPRVLGEIDLKLYEYWVTWVFARWPGAPPALLIPKYEDTQVWRQRAQMVVAACRWVQWVPTVPALKQPLSQWKDHLSHCGDFGLGLAGRFGGLADVAQQGGFRRQDPRSSSRGSSRRRRK